MRYLPPPRYAAPHFVAVFGTNLIYTVCLCIYRLFFGSCFSPAAAKRATDSFFCLSRSLAASSLFLPLCLSSNYQKSGSTVNQFSGIIATTDVRDFRQQREGGREDRGRKKETAIITRATGKSENKTCHKINKAKKKLNKNFKCKMHSKFAELLQCAIKVHARRVLAL